MRHHLFFIAFFLVLLQACTKERLSHENYNRVVGKWGSPCHNDPNYANLYFEIESDGQVKTYDNNGTITTDIKLGRIKYLRTETNNPPLIKHVYKVKFSKKFCGPENKFFGTYNQLVHMNGSFDKDGNFVECEQIVISDSGKEWGSFTMPRKTW